MTATAVHPRTRGRKGRRVAVPVTEMVPARRLGEGDLIAPNDVNPALNYWATVTSAWRSRDFRGYRAVALRWAQDPTLPAELRGHTEVRLWADTYEIYRHRPEAVPAGATSSTASSTTASTTGGSHVPSTSPDHRSRGRSAMRGLFVFLVLAAIVGGAGAITYFVKGESTAFGLVGLGIAFVVVLTVSSLRRSLQDRSQSRGRNGGRIRR